MEEGKRISDYFYEQEEWDPYFELSNYLGKYRSILTFDEISSIYKIQYRLSSDITERYKDQDISIDCDKHELSTIE
jgi:hypothetical protein